jgi:hypothetical protein
MLHTVFVDLKWIFIKENYKLILMWFISCSSWFHSDGNFASIYWIELSLFAKQRLKDLADLQGNFLISMLLKSMINMLLGATTALFIVPILLTAHHFLQSWPQYSVPGRALMTSAVPCHVNIHEFMTWGRITSSCSYIHKCLHANLQNLLICLFHGRKELWLY